MKVYLAYQQTDIGLQRNQHVNEGVMRQERLVVQVVFELKWGRENAIGSQGLVNFEYIHPPGYQTYFHKNGIGRNEKFGKIACFTMLHSSHGSLNGCPTTGRTTSERSLHMSHQCLPWPFILRKQENTQMKKPASLSGSDEMGCNIIQRRIFLLNWVLVGAHKSNMMFDRQYLLWGLSGGRAVL